MAISFISAEDFSLGAAEEKKKDAPLHWGDLEETKIYAVLKLEKVSHPVYGDSYILHLQDQAGEIVKVWAPKRLSSINFRREAKAAQLFCGFFGLN